MEWIPLNTLMYTYCAKKFSDIMMSGKTYQNNLLFTHVTQTKTDQSKTHYQNFTKGLAAVAGCLHEEPFCVRVYTLRTDIVNLLLSFYMSCIQGIF